MSRYQTLLFVSIAVIFVFGCATDGISQEKIRFDVDSVIECQNVTQGPEKKPKPKEGRLIQIPIMISADIDQALRKHLTQIRIDVQFLQRGNTIFDYSPQTTSFSKIQGVVNVERHNEKNASLGINVSGSYDPVTGSANAGFGKKNRTSLRYQELPDKKLVSATGTQNRRSGVFFKFLKYSEVPWDSERNLSIIAQVPEYWRGGMSRITIVARANRSILPGLKESYTAVKQIFYVPIIQEGDREALRLAYVLNRQAADIRKLAKRKTGTPTLYRSSSTSSVRQADLHRWFVRPTRDVSQYSQLSRAQRKTVSEFMELRFKMFSMNSDADFFKSAKVQTYSPVKPPLAAAKPTVKTGPAQAKQTAESPGKLVWRKVKQ